MPNACYENYFDCINFLELELQSLNRFTASQKRIEPFRAIKNQRRSRIVPYRSRIEPYRPRSVPYVQEAFCTIQEANVNVREYFMN